MVRLADTVACELAQSAWAGLDVPGAVKPLHIEGALERTFGDLSLADVREWAEPFHRAVVHALDTGDAFHFEARLIGALAAALILGAKLQETSGT